MRILLIVNRHARRGREPLDAALAVFARAGMTVVTEAVARANDVGDAIARRAGDADAVVLAGGDGTVNEAAEALVAAALPVGILPRGTANDLARAIGLPLDPAAAAEVIVAGATRRIDVGEVNGKRFFNVAHIGLGAALANSLTGRMKRRFGPLAYALAAARTLTGLRPFRAEIAAGGRHLSLRAFDITVGNGRYFGGRGVVAEDAQIDDGLLHLFALRTKNPLRLAMMLPGVLRGRHGRSKWVHTLTAPEIEVATTRPMTVRADGRLVAETPARFRVHTRAIAIFAPVGQSRQG
jgi:diacylglycerol kinase (ATP)